MSWGCGQWRVRRQSPPVLWSRPRAISCLGDTGVLPQPRMSLLSILGKQAFALLTWQGSWQHSASPHHPRPSFPPPLLGPKCCLGLCSLPSAPVQMPAPPFEASQHPLLPTSQDPEGSLLLQGPPHPASSPWGPRTPILALRPPEGLTLTVTAGLGRSSRAGPESPHTGHYPWSRSSSEDTFPLVVSRPPPRQLQPAAAAARPPLPCPLTPAEAPASLCLPGSAGWGHYLWRARRPSIPPAGTLCPPCLSFLSLSLSLSFFLYCFGV